MQNDTLAFLRGKTEPTVVGDLTLMLETPTCVKQGLIAQAFSQMGTENFEQIAEAVALALDTKRNHATLVEAGILAEGAHDEIDGRYAGSEDLRRWAAATMTMPQAFYTLGRAAVLGGLNDVGKLLAKAGLTPAESADAETKTD